MAENVLFLSPAISDAATLGASSSNGGLAVSYLQNMRPSKKWRTTGTAAEYVTVDYGAAGAAANFLDLIGGNLSGSATLRVRASNVLANVTAAPSLDTGVLSAWPVTGKPGVSSWPQWHNILRWSNSTAYRYWRIDVADSAPLTTYLEFGRLAMGASWQPNLNCDIDGALGLQAPDVQMVSDWGALFTDPRNGGRTFDLVFSALDRRQVMDNAFELQRLRGLSGDVICVLDPSETTDLHRYALQGVFTNRGSFKPQPLFTGNGNMLGFSVQLAELIY